MDSIEKKGIIIGLTGQTGAGKSTVCDLLKSRGYSVIDADLVARQVVDKGEKCLLDLAIEFSIEILNADGTLNRRKLADIAFNDKEKRTRLNQITHPYILEEIRFQVDSLLQKGEPAVFIDAPTLFESGGDALCDKIASVIAPVGIRIARIKARDNLNEDEARARIGAQHSNKFYTERSDFVIKNDSDISALRVLVMELLDRFGITSKE